MKENTCMESSDKLTSSSLLAVAVSAQGFTTVRNQQFIGNTSTTSNILGPFYRPGAPVREDLTIAGQEGQKVIIKGSVSSDGGMPLEGAVIELWHADPEGLYDPGSPTFPYRAKFITDESGKYRFITHLPGRYEKGGSLRPRHFHLRITARGHSELISQIFLIDNFFIGDDPLANDPRTELTVLEAALDSEKDQCEVGFDISLPEKSR